MLRVLQWKALSSEERAQALRRPAQEQRGEVDAAVKAIVGRVRSEGDAALGELTLKFDGTEFGRVSARELEAAEDMLDGEQKQALDRAIENVRRFHEAQMAPPLRVETSPGVVCELLHAPIRAVGLYVPAGSAPLPSTAVMLAVPAMLAGCPIRVLCTPPASDGEAHPAVLYVARRCGIDQVFKVGGAQAIAAMAYGTESIPRVDKIFGPGNAWVTAAKQYVARDPEGAALDLPAGPSEVLVIADETANPVFVAADLLAQSEHSPDAQSVFITTSDALAQAVCAEVERQLGSLSRREILFESLRAARIILVEDLETAAKISNDYAPEHLILQVAEPRRWLPRVLAAGSIFIGAWSPETMGDYCSGTNHVLPTYGHARACSGLSMHDFMRRVSVQELSPRGLRDLGPAACTLASMEGLDAHGAAVRVRLQALETA